MYLYKHRQFIVIPVTIVARSIALSIKQRINDFIGLRKNDMVVFTDKWRKFPNKRDKITV